MSIKKKIRYILTGLIGIVLCVGCSTRRNTPGTRAYHAFTTRYNLLFNAEKAYEEILERQTESYADNYSGLLPLFPVAPAAEKSQPGGPFDVVVDKASRAIREHSITTKPRRDPTQRQTEEYRQWLRQEEFNPLLKSAWLLLGKAHLQNRDYEEALAVFSHMQRMYKNEADLIYETEIWMMRTYTELNRMYDATNIAYILRTKVLPKHLNKLFNETYTQYLLRKEAYAEAIPWLRKTIETEKNPGQKKRLQFLLGQVFTTTGEKENAYRAFEAVKGLSTPYELMMQATISQLDVAPASQQPTIRRALEKMRQKTQNENDLEKIQTALERNQTDNTNRTKFPKQTSAIVPSDASQADSLRRTAEMHESLYQKAYQAFLKGDAGLVASTFETFREKFPGSGLMPQFLLMHALSTAFTGNAVQTERLLSELLEKFPESDAAPLARSIVEGLSQGKMLAENESLNSPWVLFPSGIRDTIEKPNKELLFSTNQNTPHLLLLTFSPLSTDKNKLLFSTANFNFSRFRLRTFDFSFISLPDTEALCLRPFHSLDEASRYLQMLQSDSLFKESLTEVLDPILISEDNLLQLQTRGTTESYRKFYKQNHGSDTVMIQSKATTTALESDESVGQKQKKIVSLETSAVVAPQQQTATIHPQPVAAGELRITPEELQRVLESKAADALQQNQERGSGKTRKELLKERERARQQKIRQREKELKERARRREAALKQREKEREQNIGEQERIQKKK